jgi:Protein of unknown function (DUF2971)
MSEMSKILNKQMEQFRVYSLSKRFDNLSLWANYAEGHTGYCLEFANEGPLFHEHVMEVIYGEYAPFSVIDSTNRTGEFLVYKRPEWSNEEEVRLIRARGSGPQCEYRPAMVDAIDSWNAYVRCRRSANPWVGQRAKTRIGHCESHL